MTFIIIRFGPLQNGEITQTNTALSSWKLLALENWHIKIVKESSLVLETATAKRKTFKLFAELLEKV